jgi:hypothetical protein
VGFPKQQFGFILKKNRFFLDLKEKSVCGEIF